MAAIHKAARDLVIRIRAERDNELNRPEARKLLAESSDVINWLLAVIDYAEVTPKSEASPAKAEHDTA